MARVIYKLHGGELELIAERLDPLDTSPQPPRWVAANFNGEPIDVDRAVRMVEEWHDEIITEHERDVAVWP